MKIALSRIHFPVTTLGPGKRIGIWFQGCSIRCEGCISVDTWQQNENETNLSDVVDVLKTWLTDCDGITISGGEPFDQRKALKSLLKTIKKTNLPVWVYSGYRFSELENILTEFIGLIDVLIAGPFEVKKQTLTTNLAGSSNQEVFCFSEKGKQQYQEAQKSFKIDNLDAMFDGESLWMAGIPGKNFFHDLQNSLETSGHTITHSQHGGIK